jgi:Xaa-Pro aminopeptidase
MSSASSVPFVRRIAQTREELRIAGLDALVVTHLPNVRYLTGFSGSAGAALVTGSQCLLVVDFRYAAAAADLVDHQQDSAVELHVADRSHDEKLLALLRRAQAQRVGVEASWMPVARFNRLSAALASMPQMLDTGGASPALVPTDRVIERARLVKDVGEISLFREAARLLSVVARQVPPLAAIGRSEQEIAGDIDTLIRRGGFERPAFDTIVASGPNSARPHARPGRRIVQAGEAVVLDFGGVYDGYCVDLTRTLLVGDVDPALRRMFDGVVEAHAAAIAMVGPGVMAGDIDAAARSALARHGLAEAFGHGTGHGLGLEVHEEPRIGRPIEGHPDTPVAAGMVFTIEPGVYVEGIGGVRIEDDVLVVEGGCEVLTDVPLEL